jgi:2-amino-4-hydroxy-6-hydroxymethyldihydropteridine diphosphokinase
MGEKPVQAFIAVGSNIAPEENIPAALDHLQRQARVTAISTFYRTAPLDRPEQEPFMNGVWLIETAAAPRDLKFSVLRGIEAGLGRVRTNDRYAARAIDLDILVYDDVVIHEPDLQIPDPDIRCRSFLAVPLLECAPDLVLPDTGESLASIVAAGDRQGLEAAVGFTERLRKRVCP